MALARQLAELCKPQPVLHISRGVQEHISVQLRPLQSLSISSLFLSSSLRFTSSESFQATSMKLFGCLVVAALITAATARNCTPNLNYCGYTLRAIGTFITLKSQPPILLPQPHHPRIVSNTRDKPPPNPSLTIPFARLNH